jgi:solute carrier family 25 carnitine/acylcarnitine transporter 20/29
VLLVATLQATLVTVTGYPFDLIKARLQSGLYKNSIDCLVQTCKHEGIKGLYRGSLMPWISHMLKRPIQYPISEYLKTKTDQTGNNNIYYNYLIGAGTGLLGPIFGTPLQVVKIAMQTSQVSNNNSDAVSIRNSLEYVKYNYKTYGIKGFYRGFIPTLLKDSIFGMSFIGSYYTFRDYVGTDKWYKNFFNGAAAHCLTWYFFIPIDYIKTNIQKTETKIKIIDVIKTSYKNHGIFVFWKGVIPACLRTIPVSGIAMMGYEFVRKLLTDL